MEHRRRKIALGLRVLVSLGILAVLAWWLPLETVFNAFKSLTGTLWLRTISVFLIGHVFAAMKWRYMLQKYNLQIGVKETIRAHLSGLFANICLPSIVGGDIVRAAIISNKSRKKEIIIAGSVVDRLIDTAALIFLMTIAAAFVVDYPTLRIPDNIFTIFCTIIVVLGVLAILIAKYRHHRLLKAGLEKLTDSIQTILQQPLSILISLTISLLVQTLFILLNIRIGRALGIDTDWQVWFFCWPLAKLIALAPISLGGIGVRDAALVTLLGTYGVVTGVAFAQSLAWQAILILSGIIAGTIAVISSPNGVQIFRPQLESKQDKL